MSEIQLYNKYRPNKFSDLIGQDHISRTLTKAFEKNRLAHTYILCGPRGSGKTTTARILAMGFNCANGPTPNPCGECPACRDILDNRCIDIIELDAASKNGVNDIRDLQESASTVPSQVRVKFFIVDEVHRITPQAQDAFLKTLEEPPESVVFVLCTTERNKLKDTILSRAQIYEFSRIPPTSLADRLAFIVKEEGYTADREALEMIARSSEGGARDAIGKLEQVIIAAEGTHLDMNIVTAQLGSGGLEHCASLAKAMLKGDVAEVLQVIGKIAEKTADLLPFYHNYMNYCRHLMILSINPDFIKSLDVTESRGKEMLEIAKLAPSSHHLTALKTILQHGRSIDSIKGRVVIETMCLDIIYANIATPHVQITQPVQVPTTINATVTPAPVVAAAQPVAQVSVEKKWADLSDILKPHPAHFILERTKPLPHHDANGLHIFTQGLDECEIAYVQFDVNGMSDLLRKVGLCDKVTIVDKPQVATLSVEEVFGSGF